MECVADMDAPSVPYGGGSTRHFSLAPVLTHAESGPPSTLSSNTKSCRKRLLSPPGNSNSPDKEGSPTTAVDGADSADLTQIGRNTTDEENGALNEVPVNCSQLQAGVQLAGRSTSEAGSVAVSTARSATSTEDMYHESGTASGGTDGGSDGSGHRKACHRCGNLRPRRVLCRRCPQSYCRRLVEPAMKCPAT